MFCDEIADRVSASAAGITIIANWKFAVLLPLPPFRWERGGALMSQIDSHKYADWTGQQQPSRKHLLFSSHWHSYRDSDVVLQRLDCLTSNFLLNNRVFSRNLQNLVSLCIYLLRMHEIESNRTRFEIWNSLQRIGNQIYLSIDPPPTSADSHLISQLWLMCTSVCCALLKENVSK